MAEADDIIRFIQTQAPTELTDSSGGAADGTVAAVSGSGADAAINANFAEVAGKVNEIVRILQNIASAGR